jgi:hypothetical protein
MIVFCASALHVLQENGIKLPALHEAAAANSCGPFQGLSPLLLQHFVQRQQQQRQLHAALAASSFPASSCASSLAGTGTAPSQIIPQHQQQQQQGVQPNTTSTDAAAAAAAAAAPCWVDPQQLGSQLAVSEALTDVQSLLALSCKPKVGQTWCLQALRGQ